MICHTHSSLSLPANWSSTWIGDCVEHLVMGYGAAQQVNTANTPPNNDFKHQFKHQMQTPMHQHGNQIMYTYSVKRL